MRRDTPLPCGRIQAGGHSSVNLSDLNHNLRLLRSMRDKPAVASPQPESEVSTAEEPALEKGVVEKVVIEKGVVKKAVVAKAAVEKAVVEKAVDHAVIL